MKNITRFSAIAIVALFIASCGTTGEFARKHHSHRKWKKADVAEVEEKQGFNKEVTSPAEKNSGFNHTATKPEDKVGKSMSTSKIERKSDRQNATLSSQSNYQPQEEESYSEGGGISDNDPMSMDNDYRKEHKDVQEVPASAKETRDRTSTDNINTDGMIILLVIVALLGLPWLSLLIYEGVTSRFWIVLLLSVIGYGYFFFSFAGLALLIAVVWTILILLGFA